MEAAGVQSGKSWHKDTGDSLRYRVAYIGIVSSKPQELTVDMRFKPRPNREDVVTDDRTDRIVAPRGIDRDVVFSR